MRICLSVAMRICLSVALRVNGVSAHTVLKHGCLYERIAAYCALALAQAHHLARKSGADAQCWGQHLKLNT